MANCVSHRFQEFFFLVTSWSEQRMQAKSRRGEQRCVTKGDGRNLESSSTITNEMCSAVWLHSEVKLAKVNTLLTFIQLLHFHCHKRHYSKNLPISWNCLRSISQVSNLLRKIQSTVQQVREQNGHIGLGENRSCVTLRVQRLNK